MPLTETGRVQARALAARLHGIRFTAVLSSPLSRALETAHLADFGDVVAIDPDLAEWDYGEYEGRTTAEIRRSHPGWTIWGAGPRGGETAADVTVRVDRVLASLADLRGNVALFAHGHVLRVLAVRWLGLPASEGRLFALGTATVSVLGWERDAPVVERWNDTSHLP
jgi:probable phosphoglycerate mutase